MKSIFGIIVALHAVIHVLGFVKGFKLTEVPQLKSSISPAMGLLWLVAAILLLLFIILYFVEFKYVWLIGFAAVMVSQILIILYWKDARFGTLPNILLGMVSLVMFGNFGFNNLLHKEINLLIEKNKITSDSILKEEDISQLPEPVKKWLHASGAFGMPYIFIGKVTQKAYLQLKPDQKQWLSATATQYISCDPPAFIWYVNVKMNNLLFFLGRDKYTDGKGRMLIEINALWPIVDEQGDKLDEGTMQRYLGEIAWFPSMALSKYISWEPINDTIAGATLTYKGKSGSGVFYFSPEGDFIRFTAQRFKDNAPDARKYEWIIEAEDYKIFEGIRIPSRLTATWRLEDRDWTWLKLEITGLKYNFQASEF